jgi:hypothetical protein
VEFDVPLETLTERHGKLGCHDLQAQRIATSPARGKWRYLRPDEKF